MTGDDCLVELLEELVAWARFANRSALLHVLEDALADDRHLLAYDLTDGSRTQVEVAVAAGIAQSTVSSLWVKWRRMGLAREKGGRAIHLVKAADIGLERAARVQSRPSAPPPAASPQ